MLWYGMSGQTLKKIKADILKKKFSKKYIMEKHGISEEQFDLICKWKLKITYKQINERIEELEKKIKEIESRPYVGSSVYSPELGNGVIVCIHSGNLMQVRFENKDINSMCDMSKMTTVYDEKKRKIFLR